MEPSLAQERGFDAHGASAVGRGEGRGSWAAMGEGVLPAEPVGEPGPGDRGLLQQRLSREHLQPGVKLTVLGAVGQGAGWNLAVIVSGNEHTDWSHPSEISFTAGRP